MVSELKVLPLMCLPDAVNVKPADMRTMRRNSGIEMRTQKKI